MKGLQTVGLILGMAFSVLLIFFIAAQALTDPGGTAGLLIVLAWVTLPIVLAVLAWVRPTIAYPILVAMVALVLLASAVSIPLGRQAWEFEDTHGPVNLMVLLGSLVPLIVLGRAKPTSAGWLMVITIVGSLLLQGISLLIAGQASVVLVFLVLMPPFLVVAILYILAGRQAAPNAAVPTPTVQRTG